MNMNREMGCDQITTEKPSAWTGHREFASWLVNKMKPEVIVDLGVDYGHSTFYLAAPGIGQVFGVDSFEGDNHAGIRDTYEYVLTTKEKFGFDNITVIKGLFDDVAKTWNQPIDLLHIDGLHTYDAVKNDYETWKKFLKEDSVIIFHDTVSFPDDVGRFFEELDMHKAMFPHSAGLGVASNNPAIIAAIGSEFNS
jgi:predicted O-methyltransferase YrrM